MEGKNDYIRNLIVRVSNIGIVGVTEGRFDDSFIPASNALKDQRVTRELIKEIFSKFGEVKHVEYRAGQLECTVRFSDRSGDAAKHAIEQYQAEALTLGCQDVTLDMVTGEEEAKVWDMILNGRDGRKRDRPRYDDRPRRDFRGDDRRRDYDRPRYEDRGRPRFEDRDRPRYEDRDRSRGGDRPRYEDRPRYGDRDRPRYEERPRGDDREERRSRDGAQDKQEW